MSDDKEKYKSNCFIIFSFDSSGEMVSRATAFNINDRYIITAAHFIEENSCEYEIYLTPDDCVENNGIKVTLTECNVNLDYAVFTCQNNMLPLSPDLSMYPLKKGDEVFGYGFPVEKGMLPSSFYSEVAEDLRNIQHTIYCYEVMQCKKNLISNYEGISGSPLIYKSTVVGIVLYQQKSNTLYCISLSAILPLITKLTGEEFDICSPEEVDYAPLECPKPPFHTLHEIIKPSPLTRGLGITFSFKRWNLDEFSRDICEWLPEYVIPSDERAEYKSRQRAAIKLSERHFSDKNEGVFLDLLLHISIRNSHKTIPIISKVFSIDKDKIPSCSHIVISKSKLELWLGISSFANSFSEAIKIANESLIKLITVENISERYKLIVNKTDKKWPLYEKLKILGDNSIPLDKRVDKIILPIFICYEDDIIVNFNDDESFLQQFRESMLIYHGQFINAYKHDFIEKIDVRLFLFPIGSINDLIDSFMEELND